MSGQQSQSALIATVISIFSLVTSALALGWNIYRDVILKPRLKVQLAVCDIVTVGSRQSPRSIVLTATNFGPGPVQCTMIFLKRATLWARLTRAVKYAALVHDLDNPLSGKLPAKLEVGGCVELLIAYKEDCFLRDGYTHVGVKDSFGRVHWACRKDVARAKAAYAEGFTQ